MKIIDWIKTHKFIVLLLAIIGYLLLTNSSRILPVSRQAQPPNFSGIDSSGQGGTPMTMEAPKQGIQLPNITPEESELPPSDTTERMVIKNSNLSFLVKDVRETSDKVLDHTKQIGGFMVSTNFNRPEQSPFATITVRVPTDKLDSTLDYFRSLAIKVTSENLQGRDVTDQYTDIEAQIATLQKIKAKFEDILDKATEVQDILTVQREIINTQRQIDNYVGQKKALEQNVDLTKITVYLSTDELALPYTPDKVFRPNVIFKQAVRSLLGNLRTGANSLIWIGVYSIIWIPLAVIIYIIYRKTKQKKVRLES